MDIQALRSTLPDGEVNHSILWTMADGDKKPQKANTLNTTKPCVFFFGGGAYLSKGEESVPSQMKSIHEILAPVLPGKAYNFYTLTSDTEGSKILGIGIAGKKNQVYNDYPNAFSSKEAESFVTTHLMPLVRDISHIDHADRSQAITETAKQFSTITFLGFSYGTAFIQEISNALREGLDKKGYTLKEKATVMKSLAAVNIGPTFRYTPKYPDIAQTTLVLASDKDAVRNSNISLSNPDIEFTHPSQQLAYAQNEAHTLIYVDNGSTRLRGLGYRSPSTNDSISNLINQAKNWTGTAPSPEETAEVVNRVVPAHHKGLQTTTFRWEITPENIYYTLPSNLVGTNSVRFLQHAVKCSAEALRSNAVRDTVALNNECIAENLTPEAVKRDAVHIQFFKQMFEQLGGHSTPHAK